MSFTRDVISTPNAPKAIGPYSQAIKANGFVFISGQIPIDPATGNLTLVPNPYYDLFCSGAAQLPDGRILTVGGYD